MAAVRHATRAPSERPPVRMGRLLNGPSRSCETTAAQAASSWLAGAGLAAPLPGRAADEPDTQPCGAGGLGRADKVGRLGPATRPVAEHERSDR